MRVILRYTMHALIRSTLEGAKELFDWRRSRPYVEQPARRPNAWSSILWFAHPAAAAPICVCGWDRCEVGKNASGAWTGQLRFAQPNGAFSRSFPASARPARYRMRRPRGSNAPTGRCAGFPAGAGSAGCSTRGSVGQTPTSLWLPFAAVL
jgi:hypothetical protein